MGSQIIMLKLRGWSGLTNNYVKTEAEAGEGSQITMLKLRGWTGLTNNYVKTERLDWAHK